MNYRNFKNLDELLKLSNQTYKFYVDLDGVLANFDKHFEELSGGIPPGDFIDKYGKNKLWDVIKGDPHYFYKLEWMPDGQELWKFVSEFNPTILSTPAKDMEFCKSDKREWVNEKIGEDVEVIFSFNKEKYAEPNAILIDDMDKNLVPWQEAGGIAIKHVDTATTIKELKRILTQK